MNVFLQFYLSVYLNIGLNVNEISRLLMFIQVNTVLFKLFVYRLHQLFYLYQIFYAYLYINQFGSVEVLATLSQPNKILFERMAYGGLYCKLTT